ncbi:MAG: lamin tail domain-containing protein, partial [Bacteroidales bacterium]|nr:lamin tail domain-containing protein [Bacteroidales bacterium]
EMMIVSASPGYQNYLSPTEKLYISEIVASSNKIHPDQAGEYDDWIEIYNDNHYAVDIGGLFITDSLQDPTRFRIGTGSPDSTTIGPKAHLVLWADNQPGQGINHLGFRLNGKGEQLILVNPNGNTIIDSVSFPDQYSHFSFSRLNSTGGWRFLRPTHGERNICPAMPGITINEFMASSTSITNEQGEYSDWIELHNSNNYPVDVGGLYLTDSLENPTKYRIPSHSPEMTTIPSRGYYVLYADDQSSDGPHHTNFRLGRKGEQIGLFHYDEETVLDSLTYPSQFKNTASGRVDGEPAWHPLPPTPGAVNLAPDYSGLIINEVMGFNKTIFGDEYNEYEDWIELYNSGDEPVDIGGLFLSDSLPDWMKFRISSGNPDSTVIPPYGYLLLWADGSEEQGILHLGMKIAKTGEEIALFGYDGAVVDSVTYPFISPNLSWGRRTDGNEQWTRFYHPTPLQPNLLSGTGDLRVHEGAVNLYPNPVT